MNTPIPSTLETRRTRPLRIFIATAAGTVVALVGLTRITTVGNPSRVDQDEAGAAAEERAAVAEPGAPEAPEGGDPEALPASAGNTAPEEMIDDATPAEVHRQMARLTSALALLTGREGTEAQATAIQEWKAGLRELAGLGRPDIPSILRFLAEGTDLGFGPELRAEFGHGSARTGLMQVLRQIGGPEAIAAMDQLLERTRSHQELALLAQGLEEADPGMHRDRILERTRGELAAASAAPTGGASEAADAAALFEILGHYGGPEAAPDLEAVVDRWKYYATSALARLPDGAGVPSLIRLADPETHGAHRLQALQVLAELAPANEAARDYLITQAGSGRIPADHWSYLRQPLSGNRYFVADAVLTQYPPVADWSDIQTLHIRSGNQTLHSIPSASSQTPEGIQRHLALIDQLLGFSQGAAAQSTLGEARRILESRMQRATAGSPAFATENP